MEKKVKVLLVSPYSKEKVGGIGTWTKLILDYSKNIESVVLIFQNTVHSLPKRWALKNKTAHFVIGSIDSLLILLKLFYNLCIKRPNVVHYTSSASSALYKDRIAAYIVTKLFKKKFIIHWRFGRIPDIFEDKGREYYNFIKVLDSVSLSIVLDKRSYSVIKNAGYKVVIIPNPISQTIQKNAEDMDVNSIQNTRRDGVVLYVGHMLETKGVFEVVKACVASPQVNRLIMVGPFFDETIKEQIIEISSERGNCTWLSLEGEKSREKVWDYYRECGIFCLPSYTEGFPNVILEAMAFACPIVATNVGAIPEMLSNNCGELVAPKAIDALKDSIENLLKNPIRARQMGKRAHLKVLEEYTIEKVYSEYENLWNNI